MAGAVGLAGSANRARKVEEIKKNRKEIEVRPRN